jgi:hypothetical protein
MCIYSHTCPFNNNNTFVYHNNVYVFISDINPLKNNYTHVLSMDVCVLKNDFTHLFHDIEHHSPFQHQLSFFGLNCQPQVPIPFIDTSCHLSNTDHCPFSLQSSSEVTESLFTDSSYHSSLAIIIQ